MLSPLHGNSVLLHAVSSKECECLPEKKTLTEEREAGVMLSAITCCTVCVLGAGSATVVDREEACDWPVCYFPFALL